MKPLEIPNNQNVLVVTTHPDDEFLICAVISALVKAGCRVTITSLTRGEGYIGYGQTEIIRAAEQAERRLEEFKTSCDKILGIHNYEVGYFPDWGMHKHDNQEMVQHLVQKIKTIDPYWIITFGPYGWTGHIGHQLTHTLTLEAARLSGGKIAIYGATFPSEADSYVLPTLQDRRKSNCYNDNIPRPSQKELFTFPVNLEIATKVAQAHESQQLEPYIPILKRLGYEHYELFD
jgi:LmbE family N-acetylglucosaminyl deacetylase